MGYLYTYGYFDDIIIKHNGEEQSYPLSECENLGIMNVSCEHDMVKEREFIKAGNKYEAIEIKADTDRVLPMVLPEKLMLCNTTDKYCKIGCLDVRHSYSKEIAFSGFNNGYMEVMSLEASPHAEIKLQNNNRMQKSRCCILHIDGSVLYGLDEFHSDGYINMHIKELDSGQELTEAPNSIIEIDRLDIITDRFDINTLNRYAEWFSLVETVLDIKELETDQIEKSGYETIIHSETLFRCIIEKYSMKEAGTDILYERADAVLSWNSDRKGIIGERVYASRDYILLEQGYDSFCLYELCERVV